MTHDHETGPATAVEGKGLDAAAELGDPAAGPVEPAEREWIFTFGDGHVHSVTGARLGRRFVRIAAADAVAAEQRMHAHFGNRWAFRYRSPDDAGVGEFGLVELPESEWPPPFGVVEAQTPNHRVLRVFELSARVHRIPLLDLVGDESDMLRAVLLSGACGDYKAYIGVGSPEWVADHGAQLPFQVAAGFFPGLDKARYRE